MTIDITSSALCWCDNCGKFLAPSTLHDAGRPGVRFEVRGGYHVVLCLACVARMHASLLAYRREERETRR